MCDRRSGTEIELARKCLALIRYIAERGALSWDPKQVVYALQELSQVIYERTGDDERVFEPEVSRIPTCSGCSRNWICERMFGIDVQTPMKMPTAVSQ